MGIAEKIIPHYTYQDRLLWEGNWELIEGHPIAMSPTPVPSHQRVAAELRTELILALRNSKCKHCKTYDPIDYKLAEDTILVPHILIVCGEIKKKYLDFPPALIVEILSPSTALRDRNTKFQYYQQQGVKYYLIVDADKKTIECYKYEEGIYVLQEYKDSYSFHFENDCTITPNLTEIFD